PATPGGRQPGESATPRTAHERVRVRVVPNQTQRLLGRPGHATLPLHVTAVQPAAQDRTLLVVQQVPRRHEIERRICRTETAGVEDAHEAAVADEDVRRCQVAMTHDVTIDLRKTTQLVPQRAAPGYIDAV